MTLFLTPEDVCQSYITYITGAIVQSTDPSYSQFQKPDFYGYGNLKYDTNEGEYPQIRMKPGRFRLEQTNKQMSEMATVVTDIETKIWGESEAHCLQLLQFLAWSMKQSPSYMFANSGSISPLQPLEITQPGYISLAGTIGSRMAYNQHGVLLFANFTTRTNLPFVTAPFATVLTASTSISGSGAYLGITDTITYDPLFFSGSL